MNISCEIVVFDHVFDLQVLKYDSVVGICKYPARFVHVVLPGVYHLTICPFKNSLLLIPVIRSLLQDLLQFTVDVEG